MQLTSTPNVVLHSRLSITSTSLHSSGEHHLDILFLGLKDRGEVCKRRHGEVGDFVIALAAATAQILVKRESGIRDSHARAYVQDS